MAKLWDKGYTLDEVVESFTVGRDYILDRALVVADCAGSIAHARMLARVGLLGVPDAGAIERELVAIAREGAAGTFEIARSDEDCHTAIENRLIERIGEAGKRVHTGRSRNDQVLTATRLYTREALLDILTVAAGLIGDLLDSAEREAATVMPGRTHLQVAMLSTWGLWLASWAEELLDNLEAVATVLRLVDRSPLGSAASYGTPLPLDREFVAGTLGFASVHNNALAVQHSRGALEAQVAGALSGIALTVSRIAQDLIIFSLPELGYVVLPQQMCSGSSIMPQKRNPDVLELLRSRAAVVEGLAQQIRGVARALPSGYNRDLQDTKEPLLRTLEAVEEELLVTRRLMAGLEPQHERMRAALNPEVFATDYAYRLVEEGLSFREAYRRAAAEYREVELPRPEEALARRTATGTPGNLNLASPRERLASLEATLAAGRERHTTAVKELFGGDPARLRGEAG